MFRKFIPILSLMLFSQASFARIVEFKELPEADSSCFDKSLILGASISSGYMGIIDGGWGSLVSNHAISLRKDFVGDLYQDALDHGISKEVVTEHFKNIPETQYFNNGSAPGPVYKFLLQHRFAHEPRQDINFADLIMDGSASNQYFYAHDQLSTHHYSESKKAELRERFSSSTIIFAIDGFYWNAIWHRPSNYSCSNAVAAIEQMTDLARQRNQVLVLGNVPIEDPSRVRQYLDSMWSPPKPDCVARINLALENNCAIEDKCYILDFKGMVEKVNSDKPEDWIQFEDMTFVQPVLRGEGKFWNYLRDAWRLSTDRVNPWRPYLLRGDGVHLSRHGENYVAHMIRELFIKNPPQCN